MNVEDGRLYPLPEDLHAAAGQQLTAELADQIKLVDRHEHRELIAALRRNDPLVAVSGKVAQKIHLGDRELQRRRGRARRN